MPDLCGYAKANRWCQSKLSSAAPASTSQPHEVIKDDGKRALGSAGSQVDSPFTSHHTSDLSLTHSRLTLSPNSSKAVQGPMDLNLGNRPFLLP